MLTHDRGTSVGMIALSMFAEQDDASRAGRSHLDERQHLSPAGQPDRISESAAGSRPWRAAPRARPRRRCWPPGWARRPSCRGATLGDPEIAALAQVLRAQRRDRGAAGYDSVPQRARCRRNQLAAGAFHQRRSTPAWCGACTTTSRLSGSRTIVWQEFLRNKPGRNRYWILPTADHYLQCDAPAQLAQVVRLTAAAEPTSLRTLGDRPDGAVLVDQTP